MHGAETSRFAVHRLIAAPRDYAETEIFSCAWFDHPHHTIEVGKHDLDWRCREALERGETSVVIPFPTSRDDILNAARFVYSLDVGASEVEVVGP
jgi:hypothetical protein